jgi:hypothetical protein
MLRMAVLVLGLFALTGNAVVGPESSRERTASGYLNSIGGEFNEAWAGAESFYLFSGSPMSCKNASATNLDQSMECELTGTQLALYPESGRPFGIFMNRVAIETGTRNRKKLVDLIFTGYTENTPGFPDGLEVQFTLRHYQSFAKSQWGTFEIPEFEISRKVRAKRK